MPWIESHQSLRNHRKTLRARTLLRVSKPLLLGHLHLLWWWALDNATDDGSLGETSPEEIAEAAEWPVAKAQAFVKALLDVKFLEQTEDGYLLHDWWDYAGKLNAKRAKDRARKAERVAEVAATSSGIPLEGARKSAGSRAEVARKSQAPNPPNPPNPPVAPTELLPTTPDQPHQPPADGDVVGVLLSRFAQFGSCNEYTAQAVEDAVELYGEDWTRRAITQAGKSAKGQPGWGYVDKILLRWKLEGEPDDVQTARRPGRDRAESAAAGHPGGAQTWADELAIKARNEKRRAERAREGQLRDVGPAAEPVDASGV